MPIPSDSDTFSGSISDGGSETLSVDTKHADTVVFMVDDGTTDAAPATYDLTQRVYVTKYGDFQFYDEVTDETARSWEDPAAPPKMEFELTNQSGSSSNYRIALVAYQSGVEN